MSRRRTRRSGARRADGPASAAPRGRAAVVLLALAAVVPYLNSLQGSFHLDDVWDIVENPDLRSAGGLLAARPLTRWLTNFTLFANYQLHGPAFLPGWHAVNILLHAACVLVLYRALRMLCARPDAAADRRAVPFFAAALFAVHPMASEPVNYIRARASVLYTLLALLALCGTIAAHRAGSRRRRVGGAALTAAAVCLAALTKEVGVLFAVALPLLYVLLWVAPRAPGRWRFWALAVAAGVGAAAVAAAWLYAAGTLSLWAVIAGAGGLDSHFWGYTTVFWRYVGLALLPLPGRLSIEHHVPYYPLRRYSVLDASVLAALTGIVLLIAAAVLLRRRRPVVSLSLAVLLLGLAPYFAVVTIDLLVEYKFYFPLTGLCVLVAAGLAAVFRRRRRAGLAVLGALCLALAAGTAARNRVWRTEVTLWEDACRKAPRRARAISGLAWALATDREHPDPARALKLARRSLDPRQVDPWPEGKPFLLDTLAEAYYANGMYRQAVRVERQVLLAMRQHRSYFARQARKFRAAMDRTHGLRRPEGPARTAPSPRR